MKQCDLRAYFDEKRLDRVFLEWGVLASTSQRRKHEINRLSRKDSPNPCFLIWKIKNTMVGLPQRRTTTFRRIGEMSRRRQLCMWRYFLRNTQSENIFINHMGFFGRYFIETTLLVVIHISHTQKWAGGHRCSLRHNVCHPATARLRHHTFYKQKKNRQLPILIWNNMICEHILMRNA